MIVEKFEYQPLKRIKTQQGRLYQTPNGQQVPSVTTVLSKTADRTHLIEWQQRVGVEQAQKIASTSAGLGTKMHTMLENYVKHNTQPQGNMVARAMARAIVKKGLCNVSQVWGIEVGLYCESLYAGTTDCVGLHKNTPAIIDFKNSRRLKKREWVTDYFLQGALYAQAHNEMFGTDIRKVVIMLSTHQAEYQEFVIEHRDFDQKLVEANHRLEKFFDL